MLLRLTSSSLGSLFFIRSSVSSTSVEFGSSSGTGLYCVGLITPGVTDTGEVAHRGTGTLSLHTRTFRKEAVAEFRDKRRLHVARGRQEGQRTGEKLCRGPGGLGPTWTPPLPSCKNRVNYLNPLSLCVLIREVWTVTTSVGSCEDRMKPEHERST